MNRNCSVCNIKLDEKNYLKNRIVCKNCCNKNRRKNINTTLIQSLESKGDYNHDNDKKRRKDVDSMNKNNIRTLILGFSNGVKTHLMNHFLHQKQEQVFIITKSLNQYPNIKAETLDEIEQSKNLENSTVVFDDMFLSKQESNIDPFFTRGQHSKIDINYVSRSFFSSAKKY